VVRHGFHRLTIETGTDRHPVRFDLGVPIRPCALGAAMWCAPGDPRMAELARRADGIIAQDGFEFGATGPFLVQKKLVAEQGLQGNVAPWWEFCPFPWRMSNRMAFQTHAEWVEDRVRHVWQLYKEHTRPNFRAGCIRPQTRAVHCTMKSGRREAWTRTPAIIPGRPMGG